MGASKPQIGSYPLFEMLGCSPRVEVYRAGRHGVEGFEKPVVVWRVSPNWATPRRVIDEARRGGFLSHANVAQVLDAGVCEDEGYVVTEYVAGASLARIQAAIEIPWIVAIYACAQVADALDYAHGRRGREGNLLRIVHGGVSAHRILLSTSGEVKLTGFGIPWTQRSGGVAYEASFESPEQRGGDPIDGRSDVYGLGVVLRDWLPADAAMGAQRLIDSTLARLPEDRPCAGEVRDALRRIVVDRGGRIGPRDVASLVNGVRQTARRDDDAGGSHQADVAHGDVSLEELEAAVVRMDPLRDVDAALALYEELGRRLAERGAGARGLRPMITALDLADGFGRDEQFARLCLILSDLCAQDARPDESLEWRTRAAAFTIPLAQHSREAAVR